MIEGEALLVMPGAYDALSARLIERAGFQALVAGGYAAAGALLGQADQGQSNMRDYADHYARIVAAVDIPVYVDADTGFGGVHNVVQAVRAFEAAGVAGLFISDQVFPNRCGYLPGKQVVTAEQMLARLNAALDARRDTSLFIGARTDSLSLDGIDAAIERCQCFMDAGADMAKPQGADRAEEIARVIREVPGPHFATLSQAAGDHPTGLAPLQALGVAAVTLPSLALFAAAEGVRQVLETLHSSGDLGAVTNRLMPLDTYYDLVGLRAQTAREEAYDVAARRIMEARRGRPG
ncbi:MAG TPA: isocitrate lyase/phosphoenolpyruvate mutase family protein [Xanthobacteraceae bacterium]|nr:isocitrate lyase/phosphoenolpyruvate mutase family protein [Xanthobacteraceae bacterium]